MGSISSVSDIRFETARDQIIDAGLSLAPDTEAYKLASSLESKKYKLEPKQLQDLSNKIQETTEKMYEAKIEQNRKWYKQIRNELVSLGETGDVSAIASAIVRLKNNDAITVNDLKLIADSKLVADYGFNPSENTTSQTEDTQDNTEPDSVLPQVSAAANDVDIGTENRYNSERGETHGNQDAGVLERGTVSTVGGSQNNKWPYGINTEILRGYLGDKHTSKGYAVESLAAGETAWFSQRDFKPAQKVGGGLEENFLGSIRETRLNGFDSIGRRLSQTSH